MNTLVIAGIILLLGIGEFVLLVLIEDLGKDLEAITKYLKEITKDDVHGGN